MSRGRNSGVGVIFLGVEDTEFQFCLKQSFFTVRTEKVPSSAGFTGKSGIFWLPPRHNKQRDPPERSDIRCLGPCQAFKQKTSPLDADFLSCAASKLLTFHDFEGFFDFLAKIFNLKK